DEMARALVLTEAMSARMNEIVFTPLERELLGAIRAPAPPLRRILCQLDTIRAPNRIEAAARAGMAAEEDANATHPPLRARLANLGFAEIPNIDMAQTSAADYVLSHQAIKDLVANSMTSGADGRPSWSASISNFHSGPRRVALVLDLCREKSWPASPPRSSLGASPSCFLRCCPHWSLSRPCSSTTTESRRTACIRAFRRAACFSPPSGPMRHRLRSNAATSSCSCAARAIDSTTTSG